MPLPPIEPQPNRQPIRCCDASTANRRPNPLAGGEMLEFGRFQVSLRRRELVSETVPIELGTRTFDVLLVLLEANGALVSKAELLRRVWPDVFVADDNLKVQICALRKALGKDRDFIRTESGRGYRFTAPVRSTAGSTARRPSKSRRHRSRPRLITQATARRSSLGW
jgi:non-specific serine/threonine protein kinase